MSKSSGGGALDVDPLVAVQYVLAGGRDAAAAADALTASAVDGGMRGATGAFAAGAVAALAGALRVGASSALLVAAADALGALAAHDAAAVASGAGVALSNTLGRTTIDFVVQALAGALTNVTADARLVPALVCPPAALASAVVVALGGSRGASRRALARVAANVARCGEGGAALHRAGAAGVLVGMLSGGGTCTAPAAAALLELCAGDAPARAVGRLLEATPHAVLALVRAMAGGRCDSSAGGSVGDDDGSGGGGDGSNNSSGSDSNSDSSSGSDSDDATAPAMLLLALIESGHFSPSTLLLVRENDKAAAAADNVGLAVVAATLALLDGDAHAPEGGSGGGCSRAFALAALARWTDPDDGLACSAAEGVLAAAALAALVGHSAAAARALAARPRDVERLRTAAGAGVGTVSAARASAALRAIAAATGASANAPARVLCGALSARARAPYAVDDGGAMTEEACAAREAAGEGRVVFASRGRAAQTGAVTVRAVGPWRVLRFDAVEQGLAYVPRGGARADPRVLGLAYIRTMAAAAAAWAGGALQLAGADALAVGLGAGALPAFLAHHYPASRVTAVELDPRVSSAARAMGVRFTLPGEARVRGVAAVEHGDAAAWLAARGAAAHGDAPPRGAALLLLDAYDASGSVPAHLTAPPFLAAAARALAPGGVCVCNVWNGAAGSRDRAAAEAFVANLAAAFADGAVWTIKVTSQQSNLVVVAVRGGAGGGVAGAGGGAGAGAARRSGAHFSFDPAALLNDVFAVTVRVLPGGACGIAEALPGASGTSAVDTELWTVRCGTILRDEADANLFHSYHADFAGCRNGLNIWLTGSRVIHATSRGSALGPYTPVWSDGAAEVAVAAEAHNPQAIRAPDGTYLLLDSYGGPDAGCPLEANYSSCQSTGSACAPKMPQNGGLGRYVFHTSMSPSGPWVPTNVGVDFPCYSKNLTPSPFYHPNGTLFIVFHCDADATHSMCDLTMVRASSWRGPFVRVNDRVWEHGRVNPHPEDPFFFIRESPASGAVSFHVILHNTPRGIHLWSADGLNFTLQQALDTRGEPLAPFVFDERVVQTDGTAFNASRRERPWLLFAEGTRSTPEVLVTSMEASSAFSRVFTHAQGVRRAAVVVQPPPETWILA